MLFFVFFAGAAHLNSKKGKISHWNVAKERWAVMLQGKEEIIAIKPENLVLAGVANLEPLCEPVMAKWQLNSMGCSDDCETQSVLCVRMARANHSCKPNAEHNHVPQFRVKTLVAISEICVGEEITISYAAHDDMAGDATGEFCRMMLKIQWDITCPPACVCSDVKRAAMIKEGRELDKIIFKRTSQGDSKGAFLAAKNLLRIHNELSPSSFGNGRMRASYDAFQAGIMRRESVKEASDILRASLESAIAHEGPFSDKVVSFAAYVKAPNTHRNYLGGK